MKRYSVRILPEAETDLLEIYRYIREKSASAQVASGYVQRITGFLATFENYPERGTIRNEVREGLRIIGFERSASVAFVVEDTNVTILRILYRGREFHSGE